jgi:hypothetical protein
MSMKLILKLNQPVIEKARDYAKANNTSLSKLIGDYLKRITTQSTETDEITPLVRSLTGVIKLPKDFQDKKFLADHLLKKYK